jgi:predicted ATPase with chaperone activity
MKSAIAIRVSVATLLVVAGAPVATLAASTPLTGGHGIIVGPPPCGKTCSTDSIIIGPSPVHHP